MLKKVRKAIEEFALLSDGDTVLVALSGGPDSVALLAVLRMLAEEYGVSVAAAHLNHGLRGEAEAEECFVRELCSRRAVPLTVERADIQARKKAAGRSTEDMARVVRYEFLERVAASVGAHRIALGHHLQDQAETVLMNLFRGSGSEGLKGMTPMRDGLYIRPFLHIERREIMAFLTQEGLDCVMDRSNDDRRHLRNRIRHDLLPLLRRDYNRNIDRALARTAAVLKEEDEFFKSQVKRLLTAWNIAVTPEGFSLEVEKIRVQPVALSRRLVKHLLERLTDVEQGIFFHHVQAVLELAFAPRPSGRLHLPHGLEAKRDYGRLILARPETGGRDFAFAYTVATPGELTIRETGDILTFRISEDFDCRRWEGAGDRQGCRERTRPLSGAKGRANCGDSRSETDDQVTATACLDGDRTGTPVMVRNFRAGDRMRPLGMAGEKKLQDIFVDGKIGRNERKRLPLIVADKRIAWIPGVCVHEEFKITSETKRILRIDYRRPA